MNCPFHDMKLFFDLDDMAFCCAWPECQFKLGYVNVMSIRRLYAK